MSIICLFGLLYLLAFLLIVKYPNIAHYYHMNHESHKTASAAFLKINGWLRETKLRIPKRPDSHGERAEMESWRRGETKTSLRVVWSMNKRRNEYMCIYIYELSKRSMTGVSFA